MPTDTSPLQDTDLLTTVLDLLIPPRADGRLPGAGALCLADVVAADLQADPRSGPLVEAGLTALAAAAVELNPAGFASLDSDDALALLQAQLQAHPALVPGLTYHLYLRYYQHPTVLAGLDQPARAPFPDGFEVEETDPELLALLATRKIPKPEA